MVAQKYYYCQINNLGLYAIENQRCGLLELVMWKTH